MQCCIKCGVEITHHHNYCEKHYPKKSAIIADLKRENKAFRRMIDLLMNYSTNPNRYITKKQLKTELEYRKLWVKGKWAGGMGVKDT